MKRAVFLDRDGVLNEPVIRDGKPYPPGSVEELHITEGAVEALGLLRARGFLLIVVTNQPDVARGTSTLSVIRAIHAKLAETLPIDEFVVCCHDDADECRCRKPRPGMLVDAAKRHDIDLSTSYMVGDRWRDIDAGVAAGCQTVLIDRGYRERGPSSPPSVRVSSLPEAALYVVTQVGCVLYPPTP